MRLGRTMKHAREKIVRIECYNPRGEMISTGAGFFIHKNGYIGTSFSVVGKIVGEELVYHPRIVVRFVDDRTEMATVPPNPRVESRRVHWVSPAVYDYAIIKIEGEKYPCFDFSDFESFEEGDEIFYAGYPFNDLRQTIHRGVVASKFEDFVIYPGTDHRFHRNVFYIDGVGTGGHWGGPVINSSLDKVLGIYCFNLSPESTPAMRAILGEDSLIDPGKKEEIDWFEIGPRQRGFARVGISGAMSIEYLADDLLSRL